MSDAWFSEKLAPDGDTTDGCHPDEAQALKKYLCQEISAGEAAHAITRPILNSKTPYDDLPRLWGFLMDALIELPSDTSRVLGLLQAIEDLPEPDMSVIEESQRPDKLWRGLPGFGHLWADLYQSGDWRAEAAKANTQERKRLREYHVRKAEIEARLVASNLASIPIDWGYETVADALEKSDALLDFQIPAAAEWFRHAGDRFRMGAAKGEESWALKRKRDLWEGGSAMTLERWSFWEKRLGDIQSECEETILAVEEAKVAMKGGK
ncbi:hypothetical protein B0T10DRAFT_574552 [Thelonectria olida]|uniref:Uncharacterized protein n=1 Tax=Thelonectria olida TaxID=1576542 RepID=A0A9P8W1R3_9HYPO|nr:hypothetical protein B0T10DRAFT_574552 [Thelonectria olida]